MKTKDTIVAPATPRGESAIAMVRLSGPDSPTLAKEIFGISIEAKDLRRARYGHYKNRHGVLVDSVVYILYAEGKSYTGEAMLEIHSHGNPFIQQKIIEDLLGRGCRMAEPGEFTRVAFLNGKLDLSQAEAVSHMIRARSDRALQAAQRQLGGNIGRTIDQLIQSLLKITAYLEAYIDFPEEDLPAEDAEGPRKNLKSLITQMESLMATQQYTTLLHEGVKTVILGEPNAGKSSLLNALTGDERVIVSAEPGTTRDYVEERIYLDSWLLRIIDTAGIHETIQEIEKEGISRSLQQMSDADILLIVVDRTRPRPTLPDSVLEACKKTQVILVENKKDLETQHPVEPWFEEMTQIAISATTGEGLDELKQAIRSILTSGLLIPDDEAVLISTRHAEALEEAKTCLNTALSLLAKDQPAELAASELHLAIDAMGRITGKIDNESMLDELFGSFCIGK